MLYSADMELPPLTEGRLIKRYKRFLADIELTNGQVITAHCPNPGSMMGLKDPGNRVWVSTSANPKRKLAHTLEVMEADGVLLGINTNRPNKLVAEAIDNGIIVELAGYDSVQSEVKYGDNSRIDLLLRRASGDLCYVEVKNVHLRRTAGLAEFPDSVTTRGTKHLRELTKMVAAGHRAVLVFAVQRGDCTRFSLAGDIDPAYAAAYRQARDGGVAFLCYRCDVSLNRIQLTEALPIVDNAQ